MKEYGIHINNLQKFKAFALFLILLQIQLQSQAQTDKKYIRQGNREYSKNKFPESEVSYRRAIDNNKLSPEAIFNIGDALYKQNKYDEASKQFTDNISMNEDNEKKAAGLYNLGNSLLQANKVKESIDAYKGSLKLKPDNFEAKYNLAYAQDLLKQQQQQQEQQQNKDSDKENQDKQDKNNDQNKQNNDQKNKEQQQQQDQQLKQQEQSISKEDAERLLNSLANDEKNVQEKVKLAKASRERKKTVKNW